MRASILALADDVDFEDGARAYDCLFAMLNEVSNQLDSARNGHRDFHDRYSPAGNRLNREVSVVGWKIRESQG